MKRCISNWNRVESSRYELNGNPWCSSSRVFSWIFFFLLEKVETSAQWRHPPLLLALEDAHWRERFCRWSFDDQNFLKTRKMKIGMSICSLLRDFGVSEITIPKFYTNEFLAFFHHKFEILNFLESLNEAKPMSSFPWMLPHSYKFTQQLYYFLY